MDKELYRIAAEALNISLDQAMEHSRALEDYGAIYIWNPARGGLAVIVANDGSKLVANSAVNFDDHLQTFIDGRRN